MIMTLESKLLTDYWWGTISSLLAIQSPLTNVQYLASACRGLGAADYTCIQIGITWTPLQLLVTDTHKRKKIIGQEGQGCACRKKITHLRVVYWRRAQDSTLGWAAPTCQSHQVSGICNLPPYLPRLAIWAITAPSRQSWPRPTNSLIASTIAIHICERCACFGPYVLRKLHDAPFGKLSSIAINILDICW